MENVQKTSNRKMPNVTISFDSGYVRKNGECAVYAITRLRRKKIKFHTGVTVKPELFDVDKGIVKKTHDDYSDLNLLISSTRSRINDIFVRYRLQFEELTPEILQHEFKNPSTRIDFHTFIKEAIDERKGEITASTMEQHVAMSGKIKEFSPSLSFSMIDTDFLTRYNRWLINHRKNDINTRYNNFKFFKTYLNIAIRKKIISNNPLDGWMPVKKTQTERVFLTEDEVRLLLNLYDNRTLPVFSNKILRHFLFMCFTGLRISDLRDIEMDQIVSGTLIFSAIKNRSRKKTFVKVPLSPVAKRLIKEEAPLRLYGKIFDLASEAYMNRKLKNIVENRTSIDKDISCHTGRHTFATMFLRKSKNIAVLQKLLGHSKIEQTMVYAHVLTEDIEVEMSNAFNDFS